jgi:uncharacterized protein (TIGR03435 family)
MESGSLDRLRGPGGPRHVLAISAMAAVALFGQTEGQKKLEFEVASFKPSAPGQQGGQVSPRPGNKTYAGTNLPLRVYMSVAYQVRDSQIVGGPAWMGTDTFDMEAQAEKPSTPEELHIMLQHLIEERFQMKFHRESREKAGFALVVDKGGPKMTPHDPADPTVQPLRPMGRGKIGGTNADMALLALNLSRFVDAPVVDKTGLTGRFDFTIQFPVPEEGTAPPGPPDPSTISSGLRESVGLRLEAAKTAAEYIIIDHIEKLTAN